MYRQCHANDVQQFRPQFKLHVMCNDAPQIDGSDSGVRRRIRRIDYISRFVDASEADPARHMYPRDAALIESFKTDVALKREFLRSLLTAYNHTWEFEMPAVIRESSRAYISDNDPVERFVREHIVRDRDGWFTLAQAKMAFTQCDYYNKKPRTLRTDLQRILGATCYDQKWIGGNNVRSVFAGFKLSTEAGV